VTAHAIGDDEEPEVGDDRQRVLVVTTLHPPVTKTCRLNPQRCATHGNHPHTFWKADHGGTAEAKVKGFQPPTGGGRWGRGLYW
jgi:hypothetical protein